MNKLTSVVYLGNIWEYPKALAALPGVRLAGLLYEGEGEAEAALRVGRLARAEIYRVAGDSDVAEALWQIAEQGPIDLGIIANFGVILSGASLKMARSGFVNFHPGLLPGQAGREPVRRVWEQGGGASGLTLHRATERVDDGPKLFTAPYVVDSGISLDDNVRAIFKLGLPLLERVIFPQ